MAAYTKKAAEAAEQATFLIPKVASTFTKSMQQAAQMLWSVSPWTEEYGTIFPAMILVLLFLHFLLYNLENISGLGANWKQAFDELRIYIQVTLVGNLLYYGGVIMGIYQGSLQQNSLKFISNIGWLTVVSLFFNKFCLLFTGDNNPEYIKIASEPNLINPANGTGQRYVYVWFSWIQMVTDLIVQKLVPGTILGYAVGKAAAAVGKSMSVEKKIL